MSYKSMSLPLHHSASSGNINSSLTGSSGGSVTGNGLYVRREPPARANKQRRYWTYSLQANGTSSTSDYVTGTSPSSSSSSPHGTLSCGAGSHSGPLLPYQPQPPGPPSSLSQPSASTAISGASIEALGTTLGAPHGSVGVPPQATPHGSLGPPPPALPGASHSLSSLSSSPLSPRLSTDSLNERLHRVEYDRQSLLLQVSVLSAQVDAQNEKIGDLEYGITRSHRPQLTRHDATPHATDIGADYGALSNYNRITQRGRSDDLLVPELLNRTTLETHKLDMMAEISQLKLKLATSDQKTKEMDKKLSEAQNRIDDLQVRLNDRSTEMTDVRVKSPRNGTIPNNNTENCDSEVERLKKAVESLVAANDEKERHIDEMRKAMQRYRRLEELIMTSPGRKVLESLGLDGDERSDTSSNPHSCSTSSNDNTLRDYPQLHHSRDSLDEHGSQRRHMPAPSATSTPVSGYSDGKGGPFNHNGNPYTTATAQSAVYSTPPSAINVELNNGGGSTYTSASSMHKANSAEELNSTKQRTPSTARRRNGGGGGYGTLPKDLMLSVSPPASPPSSHPHHISTLPPPHPTTLPAGRSRVAPPARSASFRTPGSSPQAPFVRLQSEAEDEALKDSMAQEYKALASGAGGSGVATDYRGSHAATHKKNRGIRRFFSRLRRSNSQELDAEDLEDFKRASAVRSTAGPRLGWSRDMRLNDADLPFARWDADRVTTWLHHLGFTGYTKECRRYIRNGQQLLRATAQELEKEFGMKNYFHRKKLLLHVQAKGTESTGPMDQLDHNWVIRWLDDVGLPQYKSDFSQALIDGRVLNFLTVDDLRLLNVVNVLHLLSLKRAIQVLRQNDYNPLMLRRRPTGSEPAKSCPGDVMVWTNHRVMEWLRTIDLAEYAPNLRGSGVHGALMVLEPKFGAEIFATILSIPATKTLLRRHLSTHFVSLIGPEMQHYKREQEAQAGFIPLTPNQKIKTRKFALFGHTRRARSENEVDEYVCPLNTQGPMPAIHTNGNATRIPADPQTTTSTQKSSGSPSSKEVDTMTRMLSKEKFMEDVPSSNV